MKNVPYLVNNQNDIPDKFDRLTGSWILLTNNDIKYNVKEIRSLENREILLKGTFKKNQSKIGFLNFLGPFMRTGLPLT